MAKALSKDLGRITPAGNVQQFAQEIARDVLGRVGHNVSGIDAIAGAEGQKEFGEKHELEMADLAHEVAMRALTAAGIPADKIVATAGEIKREVAEVTRRNMTEFAAAVLALRNRPYDSLP